MICRNCGAGLEENNIDRSLGIITCSHCGSLHDLPRDPQSPAVADNAPSKKERAAVELPKKYKLRREGNSLEISWQVGGLFPGLVLLIIAGGFAYVAVMSGMLFLLLAVVGIVYFAATRAFNTHRIRVNKENLSVEQGPLPWPGNRRIPSANITQLYATEHEARTENDENGEHRVRVRKYYRVSAKTKIDGPVKIMSGFRDPYQALWLEQEIEKSLGIQDTSVTGEYFS